METTARAIPALPLRASARRGYRLRSGQRPVAQFEDSSGSWVQSQRDLIAAFNRDTSGLRRAKRSRNRGPAGVAIRHQ
jgi:hypothetical protein